MQPFARTPVRAPSERFPPMALWKLHGDGTLKPGAVVAPDAAEAGAAATAELRRCAGAQFDPALVETVTRLILHH